MEKHTFDYLDKTWTLKKRSEAPNAPWYLIVRWGKREASGGRAKDWIPLKSKETGLALDKEAAENRAKFLIKEHFKQPDQFEKLRDGVRLRGGKTVVSIIEQWVAAGFPESNGQVRPAHEAERHAEMLTYVREFFATVPVSAVNSPLMVQYSKWRPGKARGKGRFKCLRTVDRELNTCSQCFEWAVGTGLADSNPFKSRPKFQSPDDVKHASHKSKMPGSDEEVHRIVGYLFRTGDLTHIVAGAQIMYQFLTGQRSCEPGFLRWSARDTESGPEEGARFTRPSEGVGGQTAEVEYLCVKRAKDGINPSVIVRPALADFLAAWQPYCRSRFPDSDFWFPHPTKKNAPLVPPSRNAKGKRNNCRALDWRLRVAAEALGLPKRNVHSMRAGYVRVRRSQGAADALIADELGQGSGTGMIVKIYGAADTIRGDRKWDWMPSPESQVPVAWTILGAAEGNIVRL